MHTTNITKLAKYYNIVFKTIINPAKSHISRQAAQLREENHLVFPSLRKAWRGVASKARRGEASAHIYIQGVNRPAKPAY